VISGNDMTTEASITKLMHLLGTEKQLDKIVIQLKKPICGEMSTLRND